ncbi:c-type mannose receptor 2 [Caerostris extrusa]|uniref:C-type mannose receptor 2 n=1 Tax=Caerostris extrusa TaxID=172846 RepID=A0AAV4RIM5_CAEEX|nr:c-type mannose receptor 2 [Caerostris extrusa]
MHKFCIKWQLLGSEIQFFSPNSISMGKRALRKRLVFLCQLDSRENVTVNTTTTITTTTTKPTTKTFSAPKMCPIGYNWKAYRYSEFCFWETTYETERLNWYQARKFCQAYGGDLASYRNSAEEDHGLGGAKGHYKGLWFGLKRGQDDVFRWVDGTELNYTNWDHNEPQYKSRSNYCVTHGAGSARWELDYCGVRRWFICKAPKVQNPSLPGITFPKTTCNSTSGSAYNYQRWFLYDNHCYLVNEEPKYSWGLAHNFCKDNNAHLASIHSFNETDFVIFIGSIVTSTDYWIGLSSIGLGSSFTWSDGTPLDFLYWQNDLSPNATESANSCVTFDPMRGFWKTAHCNKLSGIICKKGVDSSYEFPTQEPTASLPGNCEQGWYLLGNLCYKVFGRKWTQRLSWSSAQRSCQNESATLASVHSQEQQEFLTDLTLEIENDAWIGLQNMFRGTLFQWVDDSALDYVNWDVNEPSISNDDEDTDLYYTSSYERSCVEINYGRDNMGKWNDVSCQQNNAYICQKQKDPSITRQPEDPFQCSNITGWHRLGTSCYGIFELKDQKATWTEAQSKCRRYGSDLVSFKNSAVGVFLSKRITKKDVFFWTGIRETRTVELSLRITVLVQRKLDKSALKKGKYGVLNGKRMKSSYWLVGQPTSVSIFMDNCVAMNSDAKWVVKSCRESLGSICEFNSEIETEIVEDESHLCPQTSGWIDIGTNMCVKTFFDRKLGTMPCITASSMEDL